MLGLSLGMAKPPDKTLTQRAISVLRKYGSNATLYLPGVGTMNGLTAGNYIDSLGTTAGAYDSPLGMALDAAGTVGSELVTTPNVTFSGAMSLAIGPALIAGKSYKVTMTVTGYTGTGDLGLDGLTFTAAAGVTRMSGNGVASGIVTALDGANIGVFGRSTNSATASISVREVTGNHATQATAASKPTLRRGLVNLLPWSGDFSNAAWMKSNAGTGLLPVVTPGAATTPTGQPASLVVLNKGAGTTSTDQSRIYQGVAVTIGQTYTQAFWLRTSDGTTKVLSIRDDFASVVNEIFTVTPEWQLFVRSAAAGNTLSHVSLWLRGTTGSSYSASVHVAAALFQGTVTAQQILSAGGIPVTTTAPASSTAGRPYWEFDGVNDFLQTGITTGNEGWVCAGANFTDSNSTIVCSGAGSHAQKGIWAYRTASNDAVNMLVGNGTLVSNAVGRPMPANTPFVWEGWWTATAVGQAVDGVGAADAVRSGDASPSQAPLRIGAYTDGVTYAANGSMSAILYFSVLPSAADRAILRKWVGSLQGQTL